MATVDSIINAVQELTDADVGKATTLAELELDSLDLLDLVFKLEGDFGIELPQTKLDELLPLSMQQIAKQVDGMMREMAA